VSNGVNAAKVEAYISMMWHRGRLVFILFRAGNPC